MAYQGWKGEIGRVDPAVWVEMQAQYLRMLADMYVEKEEPRPSHGRTRSAYVQAGPNPPPDYQTPPHSHFKSESTVRSLPSSLPRASVDSSPPVRHSDETEEKPIHGVNKKFEEFLEEEMRKESREAVHTPGLKREFLKRRSQSMAFQMRSRGKLEEGKEAAQESTSPPADTRPSLRKATPSHQPNQSPPRQDSEIRRISSENAHLREENSALKAQIRDLEARLARLQSAFHQSPKPREESKAPSPAKDLPDPPMEQIKLIDMEEGQATPTATPLATVESEGVREVVFKRGGKKLIYPDGRSTVYFKNNDIKDVYPDGKVVYRFSQTDTIQTTFPDGLQIFQFANGQLEKHFPNKHKEINFPDGTVKKIAPDEGEETIFPDGTVQKVEANGVKHIDYVNGQKETVKTDGTRVREWPDGTVKTFPPKK